MVTVKGLEEVGVPVVDDEVGGGVEDEDFEVTEVLEDEPLVEVCVAEEALGAQAAGMAVLLSSRFLMVIA